MKSIKISVSSWNRCFGRGIHELTEISRDFRKSVKILAESYAILLNTNQGMCVTSLLCIPLAALQSFSLLIFKLIV